jgi:hypothetical protein
LVTASSIFQRGWYGWVENHYTEDAYHKCITIVNYSSYCYCYLIIVIAIGTAIVVFIVIYYHAFIWWENHCNMYRIMNHSIFNLIFWRAIFQLMVRLLESTHLKNDVRNQGKHEFQVPEPGTFFGGRLEVPFQRGVQPARGHSGGAGLEWDVCLWIRQQLVLFEAQPLISWSVDQSLIKGHSTE